MIKLTEEQFENLGLLHAEIKKKYPDFTGFNGSREEMIVLGITDEEAVSEIEKITIPPQKTEKDKILETLGLTDEHLTKIKALK